MSQSSQASSGSASSFLNSATTQAEEALAQPLPVPAKVAETGPASLGLAHDLHGLGGQVSRPGLAAVAKPQSDGQHGTTGKALAEPVKAVTKAPRRRRAAPKTEVAMPTAMDQTIEPTLELLDRDQNILIFNERVLSWAEREDVPLLERLRYLCIVSSNLDEWFEVRCAPHVSAAKAGDELGTYTIASFERLMATAHALVAKQYQLYNQSIIPAFNKHAIRLISHGDRSASGCVNIFCVKFSLC